MTSPWASFPATLVGQVGYVVAPAQLDAPAPDNTRVPIGTGPFVFSEWVPDKSFVATRNPNCWRTDADGNRLPYLDRVEFVPLLDVTSRQAALSTGDVDMPHTSSEAIIATLRGEADAGRIQLVLDTGDNDEAFVMFNTQVAPVDGVRVRRAAALCTDRDAYLAANDIPVETAAVSQYTEDSPWFNPDAGFPTYDPTAGSALIAEVEAEKGPVEFTLGSTSPPEAQQQVLVLKSQWEACGMTVNTSGTEFSKHVGWAIAARNDIRAIGNQTLPDGSPSVPFQSGVFRLTQTWVQPE